MEDYELFFPHLMDLFAFILSSCRQIFFQHSEKSCRCVFLRCLTRFFGGYVEDGGGDSGFDILWWLILSTGLFLVKNWLKSCQLSSIKSNLNQNHFFKWEKISNLKFPLKWFNPTMPTFPKHFHFINPSFK